MRMHAKIWLAKLPCTIIEKSAVSQVVHEMATFSRFSEVSA